MSHRTKKNVGVIGLGIIGRRVAENLRKRGFNVFVWNRSVRPVPNFVGSLAEVAQLCDYIQIFVSDDDALLQVVQQLSSKLTANHIVLAHSTVAPETMRAAAAIVERRGARLLDAPFTGSKMAAEKGELVYYIGGDDAALHQARHVLEASSKEIIEIGEIGQAMVIKVATNLITAATVQAGAEALALVRGAGVPPEKFMAAMKGNASSSGTLAMKLPKIMEGDYEPHFSVKHMLKDVRIAGRMAEAAGIELTIAEAARTALLDEVKHGHADEDYSAVGRKYFPVTPKTQAAPSPAPVASAVEAAILPISEERETVGDAMSRNGDNGMEVVEEVTPLNEADAPWKPVEVSVPAVVDELETEQPESAATSAEADSEEGEPRRGFFSRMLGRVADY